MVLHVFDDLNHSILNLVDFSLSERGKFQYHSRWTTAFYMTDEIEGELKTIIDSAVLWWTLLVSTTDAGHAPSQWQEHNLANKIIRGQRIIITALTY